MNISILRYDTIGSTNTEAARQARLGVNEGLCVIAGEQTAGRGRYGRTWVSEKDAGLYFSIVLRPRIEPRFLPLITLMTGVAVHDVLREFDVICDIKWVNDLLTGDKKISGILAETVDTPAGLAVVAGIGINLTSQNFSEDLARIATSVEQETGKRIPPDELAEGLTPLLSHFYAILNQRVRSSENHRSLASTVFLLHWEAGSRYAPRQCF